MIAGVPKKTMSLRLSMTERCELGCLYCRPAATPCRPDRPAQGEQIGLADIAHFVKLVRERFILSKVHLTGGEPLLEPRLGEMAGLLADDGLELALTTNAQSLADKAEALKHAGLRRVNISLDSLDADTFARITRGGCVKRTLAGIQRAIEVGLTPVKLNMTVLRGMNDHEIGAVARYGMNLGCEVRFLELMPIGPGRNRFEALFISAEEIRHQLESQFTLEPLRVSPGQSARRYRACLASARKGVLGLIAPYTHPFCSGCRRLRLTRSGQLITCLASGHAIDIRRWLQARGRQAENRVMDIVSRELEAKCVRGSFQTRRTMVAVGG